MGDVSQGLPYDPTFDARSPSPRWDKNASPSGRRLSDIHIPSPDHSVSISSSEHFDKAGLVAAQEAALHDAAILEMGWTGGESDEYAFMPEGEKPKSPAVGSLQELKSLRPIRLRNMKIGKVHRGRIISGTLCCKSVKIFAVMNVLEEEGTGDATKFVISNAVPRSATTATAQRLYPEGAQLSVREPYLKRFADGMVGILVENPNDIIFNYLPDEIPSPVSERENLLWPVYKDPSGDGPDTPVFNTYGSFLNSPSLLSRNSLNSPLTPRSPRSFLDEPLDGLTIRTIRKFKNFRKQEQDADDLNIDGKNSPLKVMSGEDGGLSLAVENVGSTPCEGSSDELNAIQRHDEALGNLSPENLVDTRQAEDTPKPVADEGLEATFRLICDPSGPGDGEKSEHPSSPTGGLISESKVIVTNSRGDFRVESEQPYSLGKSDSSLEPIPENVYVEEQAEEVRAGLGDVLDACVAAFTENESPENDYIDPEGKLEKSSSSCTDRHVESEVGADVEESPAGRGAILIDTNGEEEMRSREVNAPDTFQEEGVSCSLPAVELTAACVETVGDASAEDGDCSESTCRDGLEGSVVTALGSGMGVVPASSPGASDGCADSVSPLQKFPGCSESDEDLVGTSFSAGAESVSKEDGSELPVSELQGNLYDSPHVPCGEKRVTAEVDFLDGIVVPSSSTTVLSSPRGSCNDKSELALPVAAHLTGSSSCSEIRLDSVEARLEDADSAHRVDAYSSDGEGCKLSNGDQGHGDGDAASHQIQVLDSPRDCGSDKSAQIASIDTTHCSPSNGCSLPSGETKEKDVDPQELKSPEVVDAVAEEELSAAALRMKGNLRFARQDWTGAVELYTRAIHKAVQESKEQMASSKSNRVHHVNGNRVETEVEVVMDYSNRAEAWLRLHHYERAWADAERALAIDPHHLKSLFRKGRALLGLGDYQQALTHLESAYARAPFDKDLLAAIKLSRIGDHQSRLGIYELTDYYLRGRFTGETPTCADYVGLVQVKAASGDKGRGLFLTRNVEAGDLLLVSNPLAMLDMKCASKNRRNSLDSDGKGRLDPEVQGKLVHAVRERAKVSTKNRQRLFALCYGENCAQQVVPSMELFIPGRRVAPAESLNLEEERIARLVVRNAIDRSMVSIPLEKRHDPPRGDAEDHEERVFWGLWVLPSFINHSCMPNVSMVVIGRALFVYASRDMSAGDELLCSYFNVFQPLPQRQEIASRCWGFTCKCARCLLETRLESSLKRLYSLHSRLEPNPEFVLHFSPYAYKADGKDLAKELEVIELSKKLDQRERCWLQASFTRLYTCSRDFMGPHGNYPYLEAALRAMQVVFPGSNSTLEVGLLLRKAALKESNGKKTTQYKAVNQQLLRICQCIYGKQKTAILQSLVDGSRPETTIKS